MSTTKSLISALRMVQSSPEVRAGRISIKLNALQTQESKGRLRALAKTLRAEAPDAPLPSAEELFIALLAHEQPEADDVAGSEEMESYLEEFFHSAPKSAAAESGSEATGRRKKRKVRR